MFNSKIHRRELIKVAFYVALPFVSVYCLSQPEIMEKILKRKQYVVYPPEDPTVRDRMKEVRLKIRQHKKEMIEAVEKHKKENEAKPESKSWKFW